VRGAAKPHAPSRIGERTFAYDANGNQAGWVSTTSGQRRRNTWDEENRLQEVVGPSGTTAFAYDDAGQRILKRGEMGETVYVNQFYVVRNGAIATKHVFAGITRVASKLMPGESGGQGGGGSGGGGGGTHPGDGGGNGGGQGGGRGEGLPPGLEGREELPPGLQRQENLPPGLGGPARGRGQGLETAPGQQREPQSPQSAQGEQQQAAKQIVVDVRTDADRAAVTGQAQGNAFGGELPGEFLYFFHPDHLGSTSYVTDDKGALYEHLQYFPFGETWVQEGQPSQRIPYLFTSKELDEETGLYYFGARYYDPRTSLWVSADPILHKYLPRPQARRSQRRPPRTNDEENALPGLGGIFRSANMALFSYAHNNALLFIDPDGEKIEFASGTSAKFKQQVGEMMAYLKKGGAAAPLLKLEASPTVVTIKEGPTDYMAYFGGTRKEILLDPLSGLEVGEGKIQTPALGLLHEAAHALQDIENPEQFKKDVGTSISGFTTAEEKRVIETIESPAAKKLGEPTRSSHGGKPVQVKCPTCTK
jgi:RHS repeat-associated protein